MAGPAEDDPEQQQQEAYETVADDGDEGPLGDGCPHDGQHPQTSTDSGAASMARPMPRQESGMAGLPRRLCCLHERSVIAGQWRCLPAVLSLLGVQSKGEGSEDGEWSEA